MSLCEWRKIIKIDFLFKFFMASNKKDNPVGDEKREPLPVVVGTATIYELWDPLYDHVATMKKSKSVGHQKMAKALTPFLDDLNKQINAIEENFSDCQYFTRRNNELKKKSAERRELREHIEKRTKNQAISSKANEGRDTSLEEAEKKAENDAQNKQKLDEELKKLNHECWMLRRTIHDMPIHKLLEEIQHRYEKVYQETEHMLKRKTRVGRVDYDYQTNLQTALNQLLDLIAKTIKCQIETHEVSQKEKAEYLAHKKTGSAPKSTQTPKPVAEKAE